MKSIVVDGKEVFYELRLSARAQRLRLTVYPGGRLVLSVPQHTSTDRPDIFLHRHTDWILRAIERFSKKKKLPGGVRDYVKNRAQAHTLVKNRIAHLNAHYGFKIGRITIRNTSSRWGSCSKRGNLNFNYKIVHLRPELQDYIIVHELAHLKYFDHSKAFWSTVAEVIPNYKDVRRELRSFVH